MRNNMADENNSDCEEFENPFDSTDNTIITSNDKDVTFNELSKVKAELSALKMFVSEQLYILKQSVGSSNIPECSLNQRNNSDIYVKSLLEQINYL